MVCEEMEGQGFDGGRRTWEGAKARECERVFSKVIECNRNASVKYWKMLASERI